MSEIFRAKRVLRKFLLLQIFRPFRGANDQLFRFPVIPEIINDEWDSGRRKRPARLRFASDEREIVRETRPKV